MQLSRCKVFDKSRMVDRSGLEPPTSRLSGVCSNLLSYRSISYSRCFAFRNKRFFGGCNRDRTGDLLLARQALSQLSYTPISPLLFLKCFDMIPLKMPVVNKFNYIFTKKFRYFFIRSCFDKNHPLWAATPSSPPFRRALRRRRKARESRRNQKNRPPRLRRRTVLFSYCRLLPVIPF